MRHAIALPTGFAMLLLVLDGLTLLIGLALPLDIDVATFFATEFSGILLILAVFYFVAERFSRRLEREDATSSEAIPAASAAPQWASRQSGPFGSGDFQ